MPLFNRKPKALTLEGIEQARVDERPRSVKVVDCRLDEINFCDLSASIQARPTHRIESLLRRAPNLNVDAERQLAHVGDKLVV